MDARSFRFKSNKIDENLNDNSFNTSLEVFLPKWLGLNIALLYLIDYFHMSKNFGKI